MEGIRRDALWGVSAYRLAVELARDGWGDLSRLWGDRRTRSIADQLCRSLGSISATISEGYSRGTGRDRARFYEYALGSARESRDWYFQARHVLGDQTLARVEALNGIVSLLLVMVRQQRQRIRSE